ncbi:hypothetical protein FB451DRAFT_1247625 [Mycena latifolia]|nr:hypothetical protein FB451DRAFT_1247625 [Mycena latifolia]
MTAARAYKVFFITFFISLFLHFIPHVLERYPQTAALAVAITWFKDKCTQGAAVLLLLIAGLLVGSLVSDAYKWLTGAQAIALPATPAELEDGTATPLPEAEVAVADAEPPADQTKAGVAGRIVSAVGCALFFASQFLKSSVVSLEKPLLANVAATMLYLLRGVEVIFVAFLMLLFVACIKTSRAAQAAAAPASPPTVLFDDGAPTAAEVAAAVEEKDIKDAEKASA